MSDHSAESQDASPKEMEPEKTETGHQAQSSVGISYKNRLQEYTQRSCLPLPIYDTINEGEHHLPKFRSTVLVDGSYCTSPNIFSHRKEAEQDVARVALLDISQKIKDGGCPFIREDTVFCKSILNEYAIKLSLEKPTYETTQSKGLIPAFVSCSVFNGITYTGETGRNKKEAEQLAARAVILSVLDSDSRTVMSEIINSKHKLYAALNKVKETHNVHNGITPDGMNTGNGLGIPLSKRKEVEATGGTNNMPITAVSEPCLGQNTIIPAAHPPFHQFKRPKLESSSEATPTPIQFVPPVLEQPLLGDSTTDRKRNRRNKKKAKKNEHDNAHGKGEAVKEQNAMLE
ncbi:unnamed protein product [Ilex paraguariensis]|uniref:DRBM domain-containing protein n=1 Tax=Ilex paraguariensis TaxID=185542 RepID=A0ABC8S6H8_9AQUA